jgi:HEAT repeat protein
MEMNERIDGLKRHFNELKARSLEEDAQIYGSDLWGSWHDLANVQFEPAKQFFIERLQDLRWDWRRECISLLGFHYKLENEVLEKIRDLLVHDHDSGVRIAAASVLGFQGQFPEKVLINVLLHDPDNSVKESAFSALLELAHVPYLVRRKELKRVESKETQPSVDRLRQILFEEELLSQLDALERIID